MTGMKYRIQEGLVMEEIFGTVLLISTVEARKKCPYLTELNEASIFVWNLIRNGKDTDEMAEEVSNEYQMPVDDAKDLLVRFLADLESQNFIEKEEY